MRSTTSFFDDFSPASDWLRRVLPLVSLGALLLSACGGDGDGKAPSGPACEEGLERCGDACVELLSNAAHCGACDSPCGEGELCKEGSCVAPCPGELRLCDGVCTDLSKSPAHCGACGNACGPDEVCSEGSCLEQCTGSLASCGGSCVDLDADDDHCGACDQPCGADRSCVNGKCACGEGLQACGDICVNVEDDPAHCGACNFDCTTKARVTTATCEDKLCVFTCEPGYANCDGIDSNGCEARLDSTDHCGACNQACVGTQVCENGQCRCPDGLSDCPFGCYDLQSDLNNCGACGLDCSSRPGVAQALGCHEGDCIFICHMDREDCDGLSENGCEADLTSDSAHCGACNNPCQPGYHCEEGACVKDCPAGERGCGDVCVNVQDDVRNCGACNLDCEAQPGVETATCSGGVCQPVCLENWEDCDQDPSNGCEGNIMEDPRHCGGCNQFCNGKCVDGVCDAQGAISGAWRHVCSLRSDGTLRCWGDNAVGQLGNGNTITSHVPVTVLAGPGTPLGPVRQIAAGGYQSGGNPPGPNRSFTCALMADQTVRCWGDNSVGQLGNGDTTRRTTPTPVADLSGVRQIAVGGEHACALLDDDTMYCWGSGNSGRLGNGEETSKSVPTQVLESAGKALEKVVQISLGRNFTCALLQDGTARCWGLNTNSQLGTGNTTKALYPTPVVDSDGSSPLNRIVAIASGGLASCAILDDSSARCWGYSSPANGNLGDGSTQQSAIPIAVREKGGALLKGIVQMSVGASHICALLDDSSARCWGWDFLGRLGINGTIAKGAEFPTPIVAAADTKTPLTGISQVSAGESHTCVQLEDGEILCTGSNSHGQLGNGQTDNSPTFVPTQF